MRFGQSISSRHPRAGHCREVLWDKQDFCLQGLSLVNSAPASKLRDPFPPAISLLEKGIIDLRPLVTHVVPLDQYPQFMQGVTSGQVDGYIKGVVTL